LKVGPGLEIRDWQEQGFGLWRQDVGSNSEAGPKGKPQDAARQWGIVRFSFSRLREQVPQADEGLLILL
jgi:hypothetical protein